MKEMMSDENSRKTMSLQAVEATHAFEMKQVAKMWLQLFNEIMKS